MISKRPFTAVVGKCNNISMALSRILERIAQTRVSNSIQPRRCNLGTKQGNVISIPCPYLEYWKGKHRIEYPTVFNLEDVT